MTKSKTALNRALMVRLVKTGLTLKATAEQMGVSVDSVYRACREMGVRPIKKPAGARITKEAMCILIEAYKGGMSIDNSADKAGIGRKMAYRVLDEQKLIRKRVIDHTARRVPKPPKPEKKPAEPDRTTQMGRLLATKGKWSELCKLAELERLTMIQVQAAYHRARAGR